MKTAQLPPVRSSKRITLGTYSAEGLLYNSFCEGYYDFRGGLSKAIEDAEELAGDPTWLRNRLPGEAGICVAVFPVSYDGGLARIIKGFPWKGNPPPRICHQCGQHIPEHQ